jgi:hypothetical protein
VVRRRGSEGAAATVGGRQVMGRVGGGGVAGGAERTVPEKRRRDSKEPSRGDNGECRKIDEAGVCPPLLHDRLHDRR